MSSNEHWINWHTYLLGNRESIYQDKIYSRCSDWTRWRCDSFIIGSQWSWEPQDYMKLAKLSFSVFILLDPALISTSRNVGVEFVVTHLTPPGPQTCQMTFDTCVGMNSASNVTKSKFNGIQAFLAMTISHQIIYSLLLK